MSSRPVPRQTQGLGTPTRPPARRGPATASTIAGILLLCSAALALVEHFLLSEWLKFETNAVQAYTHAGLSVLLGLAILQGSEGGRKAAIWLSGLSVAVMLVLIPVAYLLDKGAAVGVAIMLGGSALAAFAILVLLLAEPGAAGSLVWVFVFILGDIGSIGLEFWLIKHAEQGLRDAITEWAAPERQYKNDDAGVEVALADGWVLLKPESPMVPTKDVEASFGDPIVGAVATLTQEEGRGQYLNTDDYLDKFLARRKEAFDGLLETRRDNSKVGQSAARTSRLSWRFKSREMQGFATAWQDGSRMFCLSGWTTASLVASAAPRFASLESSIKFSAPIGTHVKELTLRLDALCPLFTAEAIDTLARALPRDTPTETYFRRGYEWALAGQREIGAEAATTLAAASQQMFAGMSEADRQKLGAYTEKLRVHADTTLAEDREVSRVVKAALLKMAPEPRDQLRHMMERALDIGRLRSGA